jgi:prepilin-type processing-associated H-X9-DG protein
MHGRYDYTKRIFQQPNRDLIRYPVPTFNCPSDPNTGENAEDVNYAHSNFVVCLGSETLIEIAQNEDYESNGLFQWNKPRRVKDVTDGTATTALGSEVLSGEAHSGGAGAWDTRGMWAIQYVGAFSYLHLYTPNTSIGDAPSAVKYERCVATENMPCNPNLTSSVEYSNAYSSARSFHPDGVNVVFADGHVEFVTDVIDLILWQRLGQIDDGFATSRGETNP